MENDRGVSGAVMASKIKTLAGNRAYLVSGLVVTLLVWVLTVTGTLKSWDGFFYEMLFRLNATFVSVRAEVTLISIDPRRGDLTAGETLRLIGNLQVHKPRQIVLNYVPLELTGAGVDQLAAAGNVVVGIPLPTSRALPLSRSGLIPGVLARRRLPIGISAVPHPGEAKVLELPAQYLWNGEEIPSLEVAAARARGEGDASGRHPSYRIHYRGESGSLPHLALERVERQDLVGSLIEGRSLLVGRGGGGLTPGYATPTTAFGSSMSLLEIQGQALNTLLVRKPIFVIPSLALLAILLAIMLLTSMLYQHLNLALSSWGTLALVAFYGIVSFAALLLARRWIPLGSLVALQLGLFLINSMKRSFLSDQTLHELLFDLNAKLRARYHPTTLYQEKEHWKQITAMVVQILSVRRVIFLERVPLDHRVREVESYLCPLSDIDEKRRDYLRTPYSEAIAHGGPIMISASRPYLKPAPDDDEQYLVPLGFAGTILGFWAFSISPENRAAIPDFLPLVRAYALTISEMLYNRKELEREERRARRLWSVFTRVWEKEAADILSETLELFKNQFDHLNHVFSRLNTRTIAYDLFGRVLVANDLMLEFLKKEGLIPYQMNLLDIFAALTGQTINESRQVLRQVIVERRRITLVVNRQDQSFFLHLKPLEFQEGFQPRLEPTPFGISGVVCEVNEMTERSRLYEIKKQQVNQLNSGLWQELQGLSEDLAGLERATGLASGSAERIGRAKSRVQETLAALAWYRSIQDSGQSPEEIPARILPCDPDKPLTLAIDEVEGVIRRRHVVLDVDRPPLLPPVLAFPESLHKLFRQILDVLAADTREGGHLRIVVQESRSVVVFEFSSSGFGMTREMIERFLIGEGAEVTVEWRNLRRSLEEVKRWGGEWGADGGLGAGMSFSVRLIPGR